MERIQDILTFWFQGIDEKTDLKKAARAKIWFLKSEETDRMIQSQFEDDVIAAGKGAYHEWIQTLPGRLALIILLDQFTRNIYRDTPKAFAFDGKALKLSLEAVEKGIDDKYFFFERAFLYMPFMHAEDLSVQRKSVQYFQKLLDDAQSKDDVNVNSYNNNLTYAIMHHDVIKQFGRFPHRNVILGRKSTPEEEDFLKKPGSSF